MIDFTTFFKKNVVEPLSFKTRQDVNYKHEVIFLSSYLHDACFKRSDFIESNGKVVIRLDRDCWEFYSRIHKLSNSLLSVPSVLTISGVDECRWDGAPLREPISIRSVFIGERQYFKETAHLVINCPDSGVQIDLFGNDGYFDISLEDQAEPS